MQNTKKYNLKVFDSGLRGTLCLETMADLTAFLLSEQASADDDGSLPTLAISDGACLTGSDVFIEASGLAASGKRIRFTHSNAGNTVCTGFMLPPGESAQEIEGFIGKPAPEIMSGFEDMATDAYYIADARSLYEANIYLRKELIGRLVDDGVFFASTDGVIISPMAKIAGGVTVLPCTLVRGKSEVGCGTVLGPNTVVDNTKVGENCKLNAVQAYSSRIGDNVSIGPFSHIRPNSDIRDGVHIGDFVEVKNSVLGENTHASHLTYIGDSDVGKRVNFGCGTVTSNYDGIKKARCEIGDDAFIGCNTNLVAPVSIGEEAYTAAGSTITSDVPAGALAISRVREQRIIEGWVKRRKMLNNK